MQNQEIASFLSRIGDLLEISGANSFRVRAFRRAAEAVESYHQPVDRLARESRLTEIDGVGSSIAADIDAYLTSGTCALWDTLTDEMPVTLLDLLDLRGVGARKAAALWRELGVTDLGSLKEAAESGRVATIKGFGRKTAQKILDELARVERMSGRVPLGRARREAEAVRAHLAAHPQVISVAVTGSVRRWAETVHDLDFVAATEGDPMPVMEAVVAYEETADVIAHGPAKTSVRLRSGMMCDLRVVEPAIWGAAVHHFTGSKFHHVALRARARERGLRVSEYGVLRVEDEARIAGRTEEEVYAALGLPYIPPELREDRGEIEAADQGALPSFISQDQIRGDLHVHTTASDGRDSIEEMALAARALGYAYLCISDHSQSVWVTGGLSAERMPGHIAAIRAADEAVDGIRILAGLEVDILRDGTLDMPDALLDQLDFVVGSVHTAFEMDRETMTERLVRAVRSGRIHAIGHPTGRRLGERDPYDLDFDAVIAAALDHNVAFEINANPIRLDLNDVLARRVTDAGASLIISSDAHSTRGFDVMEYGVAQARRGWVEARHVLNALPLEGLAEHAGFTP